MNRNRKKTGNRLSKNFDLTAINNTNNITNDVSDINNNKEEEDMKVKKVPYIK